MCRNNATYSKIYIIIKNTIYYFSHVEHSENGECFFRSCLRGSIVSQVAYALAIDDKQPKLVETLRRAPGRPINQLLKDTILSAIYDVLAENGYQELTISRVARRSGVSTATVYRRWSTKQEMFFDALRLLRPMMAPDIDNGSLVSDVDALIDARVRFLNTPLGKSYGTLIGEAVHNLEMGELLREVSVVPAHETMKIFLKRAAERDERGFRHHPSSILDMLLGLIHFRAMDIFWPDPIDVDENIRDIQKICHIMMFDTNLITV